MAGSLVVIHDGDIVRVPIDPAKDDPPLVVDPDRMERSEIPFEPL
jgi:hypothetical protein